MVHWSISSCTHRQVHSMGCDWLLICEWRYFCIYTSWNFIIAAGTVLSYSLLYLSASWTLAGTLTTVSVIVIILHYQVSLDHRWICNVNTKLKGDYIERESGVLSV